MIRDVVLECDGQIYDRRQQIRQKTTDRNARSGKSHLAEMKDIIDKRLDSRTGLDQNTLTRHLD